MADEAPLSLLVYDRTCPGPKKWGVQWPGLTTAWKAGKGLYRSLGRIDRAVGVSSWEEAFAWLATVEPSRRIGEIQYWGHGLWGRVLADVERLDVESLKPGHRHYEGLARVRDRLSGPEALWWFRTCETFGNAAGHEFAHAWTDFFRCRAAGYTYIIGFWQSGLHSLRVGERAQWSVLEGLEPSGTSAMDSGPRQPNTITCLRGDIPAGY